MTASRFPAALLVGLVAFAGCNARTGSISGTVTVDGVPIGNGSVTIVGEQGAPASASIVAGEYRVEKVPIGPARIAVRSLPPPSMMAPPPKAGSGSETAAVPSTFEPLPDRYLTPEQSGLSLEVVAGEQQHDITVTAK